MNLFELFAVISMKDHGFTQGVNNAMGKSNSLVKSFQNITATISGWKLVEAGINSVRDSISDAVAQADALNKFPIVMGNLGFSAEQSQASIEKLRAGISGLPTSIESVVTNVQRMAGVTGDLEGATDTILALNNAFIVSGSGAADASRGLVQYNQMLAKNKVEAQEWKTLTDTMAPALREVAQSFGYTSVAVGGDFYNALQSSRISLQDFNARLVELDTATGGFADRAKQSAIGIGDAFAVMNKTIVESTSAAINSANKFGIIQASLKAFGNAVGNTIKIIGGLSPVLMGAAAAFAVSSGIKAWSAAIAASATISRTSAFAQEQLTLSIRNNTAAEDLAAISKLKTASSEGIRIAMRKAGMVVDQQGILVTQAGTAATNAQAAAVMASATGFKALGATMQAWLGPVSLAITGIMLLVGWLQSAEQKQKAYNDAMDEATGRVKPASEAIADLSKQYGVSTEKAKKLYEAQQQNTQGFNETGAAAKKMSTEIFTSYEEAKKAADDYNKHISAKNYQLIETAQGRAKVVSGAEMRMYEEIQGYIDEHYSHLDKASKIAQAVAIHQNKELLNQIRQEYYGLKPISTNAGSAAVDGLVNSLIAGKPKVVSATKVLTDAVQDTFKSELKERSPSRVTAGFGTNAVLGFVNAILAGRQSVKSAISTITDSVKSEFVGGVSAVNMQTVGASSIGAGGSSYNDHSSMTIVVNGIRELQEIIDLHKNQRVRERAAGAGV